MEVLEAAVKYRESKKWKSRYCILRRPSPVADCISASLYKNSRTSRRPPTSQAKDSFTIESVCSIETGFLLDREQYTIALLSPSQTYTFALESQNEMIKWERSLRHIFGYGCQFWITVDQVPQSCGLLAGSKARLHVLDGRITVVDSCPPRVMVTSKISNLRRYGPLHNRYCFEIGTKGPHTGLYIFLCCQRDQLHNAFELAKRNTLHASLTRASFRAQAFSEPSRPPLASAQELFTPVSAASQQRLINGDYSGGSIASSYRSRTASEYSCASDCRPLLRSGTSSSGGGGHTPFTPATGSRVETYLNDVFEADDYITSAPLLSLKDSAKSSGSGSPQLIVPPKVSAKRALKLSGFDGDLSSSSTLESVASPQSVPSLVTKMDKILGSTPSAGPRQIGVSLVRKVKEASRQRAVEREQKRKDAEPPLVPLKLQDPPKKKRPAPAIPSPEASPASTSKENYPSTSKKPAACNNEDLYMNSSAMMNLATSTPTIANSSTTTTCYHCHSHQPACALEAANQRRSSTGNLPDLVADSAAGTFQPPTSTVCEAHVVTVPPCPNYVNTETCLASRQHPHPHQVCSCPRCRSNYMNQGFIESLKYYYNIDNVVLQVSEKLAHCNCCNCKTVPLGQQNRYAPMGPAPLYMPMEECQRHVSESTTMSTAPEDPDSDVPSETAPSVPTSGYTTPKSEPDQIFGFDEVETEPGTSSATVIEVNDSASDEEQTSSNGTKGMKDPVQAPAEIKVECEVLSSSCRALPFLYERKAFTPPPSMTYGVDYGGLMRSNLRPFTPCAAVAYQHQLSNSSRQSIPPGFFGGNSDYPELALSGSLQRSTPHRHSFSAVMDKQCHRRSQSCADSLHDRVQYAAISHQRSVSALSSNAAGQVQMRARIGKRCESCPGKSQPPSPEKHHRYHQSNSSMKKFSKAKRFLSNLFKWPTSSSQSQCGAADDQSSSSWIGSLGRRSRQSVASLESKDAVRVQSAPPNYCSLARPQSECGHDQRIWHAAPTVKRSAVTSTASKPSYDSGTMSKQILRGLGLKSSSPLKSSSSSTKKLQQNRKNEKVVAAVSNETAASSSNATNSTGNPASMSLFDQLCRASSQNDSEASRKDLAADLRRHVVTGKTSGCFAEDPVASFHARRLSERTQKRLMDEILRPVSGSYNVYDGESKGNGSARQHKKRAPSVRLEKLGKVSSSPVETPLPTPPIPPRLPKAANFAATSRKSSVSGGDVDASPVPLTPASLLEIGQLSMSNGTPNTSLNQQPQTPIFRFPAEFSPIVESCRELNYCELAGGSIAPPNSAREPMSATPSVASMPPAAVGGPKTEYVQIDALATIAAAKASEFRQNPVVNLELRSSSSVTNLAPASTPAQRRGPKRRLSRLTTPVNFTVGRKGSTASLNVMCPTE